MDKHKIWAIGFLVYVSLLLGIVGGITGYIDPFFHYHGPVESLQYPLDTTRYQNPGIVRHFDYDAMIVGTSMTDNFRTSEFDRLFGTNTVKIPTQGGSFAEVWQNLELALESNPNMKTVLFAFDFWLINQITQGSEIGDSIPAFLYDQNPFNDVNYLLNKEVFFSNTLHVLTYTRQGNTTTSFDDYDHWRERDFGRDVTLSNYSRLEKATATWTVDREYIAVLEASLEEQMLSLIRAYPDVNFYIYFPPYSTIFWDSSNQYNSLENDIIKLRETSRILLGEKNVRLYSFHDDFEITTDLNNYRDDCHHTPEINSRILMAIHNGQHQLTLENYAEYWDRVLDFYRVYDFESLFIN